MLGEEVEQGSSRETEQVRPEIDPRRAEEGADAGVGQP
jgi:hypothetical protein